MVALIDADIITYAAVYKNKDEIELKPITDYIDNSIASILSTTQCNEYIGFLTGKGNFRYQIAATRDYKGTRSNKPVYLEVARAYMQRKYGFIVTNGIEADDAISICAGHYTNNIVCSTDKDLDQIPGKHYNWVKGVIYDITPYQADYNVIKRMLTGDTVDNIQGIPGIGDKKADKLLDKYTTNQELYQTVLNAFIEHFGMRKGISMFNEHYQLIALLNVSEAEEYNFNIPSPIEFGNGREVQEKNMDGAKLFE